MVEFTIRRFLRGTAPACQFEIDLTLPQQRFQAFCAERGVACLDLLPDFTAATERYLPQDTHWNSRGHRLAADTIAEWLRNLQAGL